MKRILVVIAVMCSVFYWSSCSNDFELIADWKDIPVVYGLLNVKDTAHYVRVEKAFLDPETSALQLAQIADSIYYPDATVKLVRTSDDKEFVFTKVDGNKEGYPREEGVFADTPNWLFKYKPVGVDTLEPDTEYQLIVRRDETSAPVTAETVTVSEVSFFQPKAEETIKLYRIDNNVVIPLPLKITFRFDKENTEIFDLNLTFNYEEMVGGEMVDKSFTVELYNNLIPDENDVRETYTMTADEFYQTVASNITTESNARRFQSVTIEAIGGSQEFADYFSVNQANTGLTSSQLIPNYTNFTEGYGLFASIDKVSQTHILNLISRDSLKSGQYTKDLNFQ